MNNQVWISLKFVPWNSPSQSHQPLKASSRSKACFSYLRRKAISHISISILRYRRRKRRIKTKARIKARTKAKTKIRRKVQIKIKVQKKWDLSWSNKREIPEISQETRKVSLRKRKSYSLRKFIPGQKQRRFRSKNPHQISVLWLTVIDIHTKIISFLYIISTALSFLLLSQQSPPLGLQHPLILLNTALEYRLTKPFQLAPTSSQRLLFRRSVRKFLNLFLTEESHLLLLLICLFLLRFQRCSPYLVVWCFWGWSLHKKSPIFRAF